MWDWWFLQPWTSFGVRSGNRDETMQFKFDVKGDYYKISSVKFPKFKLGKKPGDNNDV